MQAVAPLSASPVAARSDGRRCRPGQGTERRRPHNGQQDRDTGLATANRGQSPSDCWSVEGWSLVEGYGVYGSKRSGRYRLGG